ncbi:hypothetical protein [uncultured Aquimarina sp.]|uniref:hypothetical protein n=1 Tax=uncultured Aquimarina sp. TaxID=575652 RepID=UPI002606B504|nr:hypothetical protein [uncultured Aquimarina sp.]
MCKKIRIQSFLFMVFLLMNGYMIGQTSDSSDVINENKLLIYKLFNSIGYRSIDLVLIDRVYIKNPDAKPDIEGVVLDSLSSMLTDQSQDIENVKKYIDQFIVLRDQYLDESAITNSSSKDSLKNILESDVIINSIIKSNGEKSLYVEFIDITTKEIEQTQNKLLSIKEVEVENSKIDHHQPETTLKIKQPVSVQGFETIIKDYSAILLVVLVVSLVLNILLEILFFKLKKRSTLVDNTISNIPETKTNNLSTQEIEKVVKETHNTWISDLTSSYNTNCIATVQDHLEKSKSELLLGLQSNQFSSRQELQTSINQRFKNDTISLETLLRQCNDRKQATEKIEQELQFHSFIPKQVGETVSIEEIRTIMDRYKRNLVQELPITINNEELSNRITETKQYIFLAIEQRTRENLTVYFPFTDAQGMVLDDKKSKIRERDSAIQFIIDPNYTSRATFSLLYDYPDMMQAAIQSYDVFLLPICNLTSENFNRNGTVIEQLGDDGEMKLEGNQWKIVKKVTIKII